MSASESPDSPGRKHPTRQSNESSNASFRKSSSERPRPSAAPSKERLPAWRGPLGFLLLFILLHGLTLLADHGLERWFLLQSGLQLALLLWGLTRLKLRLFALLLLGFFLVFRVGWLLPADPPACLEPQEVTGLVDRASFHDPERLELIEVELKCGKIRQRHAQASVNLGEQKRFLGWFLASDRIKLKHVRVVRWDSFSLGLEAKQYTQAYNRTQEEAELNKSGLLYRLQAKGAYYLKREANALYQALVFADKSHLAGEDKNAIKKLGLSHLFAISGMHIGIFFLWARFLGLRLIPWPRVWMELGRPLLWIDLGSLLIIFFYVELIGAPISALRSAQMLLWWVLARHFLPYQPLWLVLLGVASLLLLVNPLSFLDLSFQFSFISVSAIFLIAELLPKPSQKRRALKQAGSSMLLSGWIFLFLLPLTLTHFQEVSALSVPSNVIHIAYMSLLYLPLALLTMVLSALSLALGGFEAEWALFLPLQVFGDLWMGILDQNAKIMDLWLLTSEPWPIWVTLLYFAIFVLCARGLRKKREGKRLHRVRRNKKE